MLAVIIEYLIGFFQAISLLLIIMFASFHRKNRNASTIIYFIISSFIVLLSLQQTVVEAHGNGGPKSRCDSMTPGHWVNAQKGLSPYQILVDKTVINPGDRVNITLKTIPKQTGFKGFFVMVKEAGGEEEEGVENLEGGSSKAYGFFDLESSDMNHAQPVDCFDQRNSAMTHVVNYVKDSVELSWIAPKLISEEDEQAMKQIDKNGRAYVVKELKVVATFVRDFWTYWADVEPLGDVRLVLTDTYKPQPPPSPISPKFQVTPKFSSPQFRGNPIIEEVQFTPPFHNQNPAPVELEEGSSWNHFKRAWNFVVDLFQTSSSSSSSS